MIRQLLRAHEYWRMKQLSADVVIINEKAASYMQDFQGSLEALVHGSQLRLSPDTETQQRPHFSAARRPDHSADTRAAASCRPRGVAQPARHALRADCDARSIARRRRPPRPTRLDSRGQVRGSAAPQPDCCNFSTASAVCRKRPRVRHRSERGLAHAGAVDQRDCQSGFRISGLRIRIGIHVVAQQPRKSESRRGPTIMSSIPPGEAIYRSR